MKLTIIALHILGITAMVILIFLLLTDAKWENPSQSNYSTIPCWYKRNQTILHGPVIRPRDTCSWKEQLERTRSWEVLSWKVALKLERTQRSWKEPTEVGKNRPKLESFF